MRKQLEIGPRRLTYLDSGEGRPLVLIHGFPLNAGMWISQLNALPDGWRIVAPDLRGFGGSRPPADREGEETTGHSMRDFAADVADLLEALRIDRAVIGGLSMGGYVVFELFRRAPERFLGLVLADTRAQADTEAQQQARREMQALVDREGPAGVADQMLPKLLAERTRKEFPDITQRVRDMIEASPAASIKGALDALMARPDSTGDLARIQCPTLILAGEQDALTPVADSEAMRQRIGGSVLEVIAGAGHLSNLERPDEFNAALSRFLAGAFS